MLRALFHMRLLFVRQWCTIRSEWSEYLLNFFLIWPVLFSLSNGLFAPTVFFASDPARFATIMMTGIILLQSFVIGYILVLGVLEDRDATGVFAYHVTCTSFELAFIARFVFYHMLTFVLLCPVLPMAALILQEGLQIALVSWPAVFAALFVIAGFIVAYMFLLTAMATSVRSVEHLWAVGVEPALWIGGFWIPAHALIKSGVPVISSIAWYNPFIYVTELLRQIFFHSEQYASIGCSVAILLSATVVCGVSAYSVMRYRMDAV